MGLFRVIRHSAEVADRPIMAPVELLFVLLAIALLDVAAVLFGTDSREHTLTGEAAHGIG